MNTLQSSLYAIALAVCLLCISLIRRGHSEVRERSRFLIGYLAIDAFAFVLEWLMLHPTSPAKALWLGLLMAVSLCVAPCLWLFARTVTDGTAPKLREISKWHWWAIVAGAVLTIPLISTAHFGVDYADPQHPAGLIRSLIIHSTMLMCVMIFLCQVPYYLNATIGILARHTRQSKALFSTLDNPTLDSVRLLTFAVFTKWFVGLLRVLHCVYLGKDFGFGVVFALLEVCVTVYVVLSLMRQTAFDAEDRKLVHAIDAAGNASRAEDKYARSGLDGVTRARIRRKLEQAMSQGQVFRDNRLTLRALCDHTRENPHYVSQVINQEYGENFYDFVNRHRIEHAKAALAAAPDKTVLEIALDAGFNSKSTFNAAFRDRTGCTPTAYRRTALSGRIPVELAE